MAQFEIECVESKNKLVNLVNKGYNCPSLGKFPLNLELVSERNI